ncbi:hypothetical protein [Sphingobacterium zeae]|uniref:hypothetical protein n=1 Tax=Sphingobacterium zeae TaxID=1776859 RepID=UPI0036102E35
MFRYTIIVFVLLSACSRNAKTADIDPRIINEMSHDDRTTPSRFDIDFFVRCKDGKVAMLNEPALWGIYRENEKNMSYEKFLDLTLNQKKSVEESSILNASDCVLLDQQITHYYQSHNLKDFLLEYFTNENNSWRLRDGYSKSQTISISYYCFINNKFLQYDDYIGIYTLIEPYELFPKT